MTPEETIAKSRELDRFLVRARNELMPLTTGTRSKMLSVKELMQPVQDAMDDFRGKLQRKVADMARDIRQNGDLVVKRIDDEHNDTLRDFADMLGNEHAGMTEDLEGKPQAGELEKQTITADEVGTVTPNVSNGSSS